MGTRMRPFVYFLLVLIMTVQPVLTTGMTVYAQENTTVRQVKIAIFSDIHYEKAAECFSAALGLRQAASSSAAIWNMKSAS